MGGGEGQDRGSLYNDNNSSSSSSSNRRGARFVEALEKANQYKQGIYEKAKNREKSQR